MSLARKKFTEFKERAAGAVSDAELDEFWATLEPASIDGMIGEWEGGEFNTGHVMCGQLKQLGWFGKTFKSASDVQPLIWLDENGNKFSNVEMGNGEASLWLEQFRDEVVATMVYDGQPAHDHFKKIDDDAVFGIMNGKMVLGLDNGRHYYFYLERVQS